MRLGLYLGLGNRRGGGIPANAVFYNGEPVTYDGEYVTYEAE
ncbi:hypothetical protein ROJ8625_04078 [Roseivivax jejudonensis]|uniref:Uncharacterized protein n=1 Tax=Roseivivax jejudonensis TaxID=1529041 RepID=A0A1X7AAP9_9RHOB|nr:hypothetical protein [Roseivivax jejudonensis]SLN74670.1 hypothetical protein ROJ8625_04078 [Roseivivax jejudonensis]